MTNQKLRLASLYRNFKTIQLHYGAGPASKGFRDFMNRDLAPILALNRGLIVPTWEYEDPNEAPVIRAIHNGGEIDHRDISFKTREEILAILHEMIDDSFTGALGKSPFTDEYGWMAEDIVDASDEFLEVVARIRAADPNDMEVTEKEFNYGRMKSIALQNRPTRGDIEPAYEEYDIL